MTQFGRKGPARPVKGLARVVAPEPLDELEAPSPAARRQVRRVILTACAGPLFLLAWWLVLKVGAGFSDAKPHEEAIPVAVQCVNADNYAACVRSLEPPRVLRAGALQLTLACDAITKGTGSEQVPKIELLVSIDDDTFALGLGKAGPIDHSTLSHEVQVGSKKITLYSGVISPKAKDPITIYRDTWKIEFAGREGFSFSGNCQTVEFRPLRD
jgi:hypothetical protein